MMETRGVEVAESSTSTDDIYSLINRNQPDAIVVADNVLMECNNWHFPTCKTVGYITAKNIPNNFDEYKIPVLGYVRTSEHLLNLLECELPDFDHTDIIFETKNKVDNITADETTQAVALHGKSVDNSIQALRSDTSEPLIQKSDDIPSGRYIDTSPYSSNGTSHSETYEKQPSTVNVQEKLRNNMTSKNENSFKARMEKDLKAQKNSKAKVVTVYAGKGGVGKTTISTELAVYLSQTSVGRGLLRVCLVDYNIDYGNVLTTLNYDPNGNTLTFWAEEVKERLNNGESPEDIKYSRSEIEARLQCSQDTGLYALIAPISHEDSYDIEGDELEIILNNIVENGEFDFVVCDTGNNTRDSSVFAVDRADVVLMVVTQDVTTASCNSAFLSTMKKLDFDTSKIKLVINSIMPYKYTQVSVQELEDIFDYECIAHIKRSPDIIKANNCSEPIVLTDNNHDFTKGIKKIVDYLLGPEKSSFANDTRKQGVLKRLFRRNK
ncbi:MAG: P-loop NTPase [Bacteroidales bacterium]|nr:P-loop NTPase [Bacteroidales bacterium]